MKTFSLLQNNMNTFFPIKQHENWKLLFILPIKQHENFFIPT